MYRDRRGCHKPAHKLSSHTIKAVKDPISSFHPAISHYHRAHDPLRRYFLPHLNLKIIFELFQENSTDIQISYQSYLQIFNAENISFTKLGEKECEVREDHKHDHC